MTNSAPPSEPADGQLLGVAELAAWLRVPDRTYVSRWVASGRIPDAPFRLAMGPIWVVTAELRAAVEAVRGEYHARQ